jgi:hypothetical protein
MEDFFLANKSLEILLCLIENEVSRPADNDRAGHDST